MKKILIQKLFHTVFQRDKVPFNSSDPFLAVNNPISFSS